MAAAGTLGTLKIKGTIHEVTTIICCGSTCSSSGWKRHFLPLTFPMFRLYAIVPFGFFHIIEFDFTSFYFVLMLKLVKSFFAGRCHDLTSLCFAWIIPLFISFSDRSQGSVNAEHSR